jgi:hypothetical protein
VRLQRTPQLYEEFLLHFWKQEAESRLLALQYKESIIHHHSPAEIALRAAIRNFSTKFKSTLSAAVEVSIKSKIVNMLLCVHIAHLSNPSDISNIFHNNQQDVRVLF